MPAVRNEDLVLEVGPGVDQSRWNESRYEGFIDERGIQGKKPEAPGLRDVTFNNFPAA